METVTDFIFLGTKITVDSDCSHEVKRRLLLGRKAMTNLNSILKSRDITLPTKVHIVKAMIFPAVVYECEIWTIKKAVHQRNDAFELWCWRKLFESLSDSKLESISSSVLSFLYGPTLTPVYDYWKNHSFNCIGLCQPSTISAF